MAANTFTQRIKVQLDGAGKATNETKKLTGGMNNLAKSALKAGAAYFTAQGIIAGVQRATQAFAEQELAEKKLRFAAGDATNELIRQAKALQSNTRFGDEAIIAQQAYVKSLGHSTEMTKEIIEASVDLASAMNMELESAVRNTTNTLSGMQGELGEKLPAAFKELTQEQLKAGEGIKFIREQFRGTAEEEVDTLTGSLSQMGNAIGDAFEALGSTFAPAVIAFAKGVKMLAEGVNALFDFTQNYHGVIEGTGRLLTEAEIAQMGFSKAVKEMIQPQVLEQIRELNFLQQDYTDKQLIALVTTQEFKDSLELATLSGAENADKVKLLMDRLIELSKVETKQNDIIAEGTKLRKSQAEAAFAVGLSQKSASEAATKAAGVFITAEIKKIVAQKISLAF